MNINDAVSQASQAAIRASAAPLGSTASQLSIPPVNAWLGGSNKPVTSLSSFTPSSSSSSSSSSGDYPVSFFFTSPSGLTDIQIYNMYIEFADWARNSLEVIRPYVLELSHAFLLQCYLELILMDGTTSTTSSSSSMATDTNAMMDTSSSNPTMLDSTGGASSSPIRTAQSLLSSQLPYANPRQAYELTSLALITDPSNQLFRSITVADRKGRLEALRNNGISILSLLPPSSTTASNSTVTTGKGSTTATTTTATATATTNPSSVSTPYGKTGTTTIFPPTTNMINQGYGMYEHSIHNASSIITPNLSTYSLPSTAESPYYLRNIHTNGNILANLADPNIRIRVILSPLALQLALEYLLKNALTSSFLLGRLNDRIAISITEEINTTLLVSSVLTKKSSAISGNIPLPVMDVVTNIARTAERLTSQQNIVANSLDSSLGGLSTNFVTFNSTSVGGGPTTTTGGAPSKPGTGSTTSTSTSTASSTNAVVGTDLLTMVTKVINWGVPMVPSTVFIGNDKVVKSSVPSTTANSLPTSTAAAVSTALPVAPMPDYRSNAFGRAILSGAVESLPTSLTASSTSASSILPSLRTALLTNTEDHLLHMTTAYGPRSTSHSLYSIDRVVAASFTDGRIKVWTDVVHVHTKALTTVCVQSNTVSTAVATAGCTIAISPCLHYVISGHMDGTIRLWHIGRVINHIISNSSTKPSSDTTVSSSSSTAVNDTTAMMLIDSKPEPSPSSSSSSSENTVASAWLAYSIAPLVVYTTAHNGLPVWSITFHPFVSNIFVSGGYDGCAYIWSTAQTEPLRICAGHTNDINHVRVHPNGLYLGTASFDGSIRIWEMNSGECLRALPGHGATITSLEFTPGGRYILTGDKYGEIRCWDIHNGDCCGILQISSSSQSAFQVGGLVSTFDGRQIIAVVRHSTHLLPTHTDEIRTGNTQHTFVCVWNMEEMINLYEQRSHNPGTKGSSSTTVTKGLAKLLPSLSSSLATLPSLQKMVQLSSTDKLSIFDVKLRYNTYTAQDEIIVAGEIQ